MTPDKTPDRTSDRSSSDPVDVVSALLDGVCRLVNGDRSQVERLADLYAEETLVTHPMAPLGDEPLRSRGDLRRHFAAGPGSATGIDRFEAVDVVVHRTTDPEVVVARFVYLVVAGQRRERVPCVFVTRVRGGEIVESHDHVDHVAMARAVGFLPRLAAELATASAG